MIYRDIALFVVANPDGIYVTWFVVEISIITDEHVLLVYSNRGIGKEEHTNTSAKIEDVLK